MPRVPTNVVSSDNLPQGIDRADGQDGRLGTATTGLSVQTPGGGTTVEQIPINEVADSPVIERAEQGTVTHSYSLSWQEALNRLAIYSRGTLVVDSGLNYWRVLSATAQHLKGDAGKLSLTAESISFDVPPDEFQINPVRLNIDILKHPRYFYALMPTNQIPSPRPSWVTDDTDDEIAIKQSIIRAIQIYRETPFAPQANTLNTISGFWHDRIITTFGDGRVIYAVSNPNFNDAYRETPPPEVGTTWGGDPYPPTAGTRRDPNPRFYYKYGTETSKISIAIRAAQEIITKLWRLEDTPMVNGVELIHSSYYFRPPPLNLGGYREDPRTGDTPIPDYFLSTATPPNGTNTIFDNLAAYAPQLYSQSGISTSDPKIDWLRDADTIEYQRTWFRVTRKWLGAPIGMWDPEIYSTNFRPTSAGEYKQII